MTDLEKAIAMLEKVKATLASGPSANRASELKHEIGDLLTELGHTPPERLPIGVYTLEQAGNILSLSPATLRGQVGKGRLHGTMLGNTWVVTKAEIDRYRMESLGRVGRPEHDHKAPYLDQHGGTLQSRCMSCRKSIVRTSDDGPWHVNA